jgi:hypothetical protein
MDLPSSILILAYVTFLRAIVDVGLFPQAVLIVQSRVDWRGAFPRVEDQPIGFHHEHIEGFDRAHHASRDLRPPGR